MCLFFRQSFFSPCSMLCPTYRGALQAHSQQQIAEKDCTCMLFNTMLFRSARRAVPCCPRSFEDVYSDPGSPLSRRTSAGTYILAKVDGKRQLLMAGTGASPEGNRPFLDLLDVDSKETRRLWQSSPPYLESVGSIMSDHNDVSELHVSAALAPS